MRHVFSSRSKMQMPSVLRCYANFGVLVSCNEKSSEPTIIAALCICSPRHCVVRHAILGMTRIQLEAVSLWSYSSHLECEIGKLASWYFAKLSQRYANLQSHGHSYEGRSEIGFRTDINLVRLALSTLANPRAFKDRGLFSLVLIKEYMRCASISQSTRHPTKRYEWFWSSSLMAIFPATA